MRLLGCFSKTTIVIDATPPPSLPTTPPSSPPPKKLPDSNFVPASIPELHPEYAHSEPYCFAAKTDSARLLIDRARRARGQPPLDPASHLRQQGHVVIRGPTHSLKPPIASANKPPLSPTPAEPPTPAKPAQDLPSPIKHVPLKVETPGSGGQPLDDSDVGDENEDVGNVPRKMPEKKTRSMKKEKKEKPISRRTSKVKSKDRPRKGKTEGMHHEDTMRRTTPTPRMSDTSERSDLSLHRRGKMSRPDLTPRRTYSSSDHESDDAALQNAMGRTPPALLAPILAPRMSNVFPERQIAMSPSVSVDSWAASDSAARFDDIEDDGSSGFISMAAVGKGKVVHKAETSPTRDEMRASLVHEEIPPVESDDGLFRADASPVITGGMRSKRKSKPFLQSLEDEFDAPAPELAPDSAYSADIGDRDYARMADRDDDRTTGGLGTLGKAANTREISAGALSDEILMVDTSGDDLYEIPSPAAKIAAKQRVQHDDYANLPRAPAHKPQGIMRRASTGTKRKTVSFHDAAPVIIEPDLRAPSKSLPRELMLSKDNNSSDEGEFKDALDGPSEDSSFSVFNTTRDAASFAPPPVTMEIPSRAARELSDSTASEDNFIPRSSRRMSRVSIRDKAAIREASKRQSQAVAKAMSEQIRGVPRSAMLAYSEHEVLLSDDPQDADEEPSTQFTGTLSFRRRSRPSKSIRMPPKIVPGQVPTPPPPPPFQPPVPRARSVRMPPPPPKVNVDRS